VWKFLKKLKIEVSSDSAIPFLGACHKESKTVYKRYKHTMFIVVLFTITKIWNQPRCPSTDG
jgi:hypothetical protein